MAVSQSNDTCSNNHAVLSPLWTDCTLSTGNLKAVATGNAYQWAISTIAIPTTGKWVFEAQSSNIDGSARYGYVGICQMGNHGLDSGTNYIYGMNVGNGEVVKNNSVLVDIGAGPTTSLMRIEYDADADTIKIFDDNSEVFPASTGVSATVGLTGHNSLHFYVAPYASGTDFTANFGASSFTNDPTSGYLGLNTTNLYTNSAPTIGDGSAHFQATTYSGNGGSNEINQSGNSTFQPDLVWLKERDGGNHGTLIDVVRGGNKGLYPSLNFVEYTESNLSFDADGFSLSTTGAAAQVNSSSNTYIGWQWKAGGSASADNTGNVTVQLSANQTAGFSIGTFNAGVQGSGITLGHGLGAVPKMIWMKSSSAVTPWWVYFEDVGNTKYLQFGASGNSTPATNAKVWRNTTPTSTIFTTSGEEGGSGWLADNQDNVFYAFAEIPGFSKFGSFSSGSSGDPFVECGFTPALIFLKRTSSADDWYVHDTARDPNNPAYRYLIWNTNAAEASNSSVFIDIISNGFVCDLGSIVTSSDDMVFGAWAEHPFAGSAPATAR